MGAILATGGAALAVNASVLDPETESAPASPEVVAAPSSVAPIVDPALAPNEFQIPGVGLVTLSTVSGVLTLDKVTANAGFSYTVTESVPGDFRIQFKSANQVVTFTARMVDGQIVTSATGMDNQTATSQPTNSSTPAQSSAQSSKSSNNGGGQSYGDDDGFDYDDGGYEGGGGFGGDRDGGDGFGGGDGGHDD